MALPTVTRVTQRFLGDGKANVVHDLYNESKDCGIVEILAGRRAMRFIPDSIAQALFDDYAPCPHCLNPAALQTTAHQGDEDAETDEAEAEAQEAEE